MNPVTHQHTWNTVAGTSAFFAVRAAAIGDDIQQNFPAIVSVVAVLIGLYFQLQERRRNDRIAALQAELKEAQIQAEIDRTRQGIPTVPAVVPIPVPVPTQTPVESVTSEVKP